MEVLSVEESRKAISAARRAGMLSEMRQQVESIGLNPKTLADASPLDLFNIRYRPEDVHIFDEPIPLPVDALAATYYGTLLDVPKGQEAMLGAAADLEGLRERNIRAVKSKRSAYVSEGTIDLVHKRWQKQWRSKLPALLSECIVRVECSFAGNTVDMLIEKGEARILFELKTTGVVRQAIREALSQLLEYAYWPPADKRIDAIVIVAPGQPAERDLDYIAELRQRFQIPLHYLKCDGGEIVGLEYFVSSIFSGPVPS